MSITKQEKKRKRSQQEEQEVEPVEVSEQVEERKSKKMKKTSDGELPKDKKAKKSKKEKKEKKKRDTSDDEPVEDAVMTSESENAAAASDDSDNEEGGPRIKSFRVSATTVELLANKGIKRMFPIQAATFDYIYDGNDVIGRAKTGTGKTLGFALPVVERLRADGELQKRAPRRAPKVLVMAPTRELAQQVHKEFQYIAGNDLTVACIYGGAPEMPQIQALNAGTDVVVGTPGRIQDMLNRGALKFTSLKVVVLDEADQMLNVGFQEAVEQIMSFVQAEDKEKMQTLLFSATMPRWIRDVINKFMKKERKTVDLVNEDSGKTNSMIRHLAILSPYNARASAIADVILVYGGPHARCIVFTQTKKEANELALNSSIKSDCQVLHGDIPQAQREVALQAFRDGRFKVLIATDVAARGLDIPDVELVIQYQPPKELETYIHRAGRTGRAGKSGTCLVFFTSRDAPQINYIENRAGLKFTRVGCPQPEDVIKAGAKGALESIAKVHESVLPLYKEAAEELIEKRGAVEALSAALALVCGHTEQLTQRSLLCSMDGFTTFILTVSNMQIRTTSFVWGILRKLLAPEVTDKIRGMKLFADLSGAAFDVPVEHTETVKNVKPYHPNTEIQVAKTLPELLENNAGYGNSGFSSNGYGNNGYNSRPQTPRGSPHQNRYGNGGAASNGFGAGRQNGGAPRGNGGDRDTRTVFMGGLSFDTTEDQIRAHVESVGEVEQVRPVMDQASNTFKGVAFVTFTTPEGAQEAVKLNGSKLNKRPIRVNMASAKPGRS